MEIEEDLNLKILDEVKRGYLSTFEQLRSAGLLQFENNPGSSSSSTSAQQSSTSAAAASSSSAFSSFGNSAISQTSSNKCWSQVQWKSERVTVLFKLTKLNSSSIKINALTNGVRRVFEGEYHLCGKTKLKLQVIAKTLSIEAHLIAMFSNLEQMYILHGAEIFSFVEGPSGVIFVLDEKSLVLEDESMDFTTSLRRLTSSDREQENLFEACYASQLGKSAAQRLTLTHLQLLTPRVIGCFEGIIIDVKPGNNLLQIEELLYNFHLNSRRDRFFKLTVRSAANFLDEIEVFLIYDVEDIEATQQLAFYLKPFQRIMLSQALRHFNKRLYLFVIAYYRSSAMSTATSLSGGINNNTNNNAFSNNSNAITDSQSQTNSSSHSNASTVNMNRSSNSNSSSNFNSKNNNNNNSYPSLNKNNSSNSINNSMQLNSNNNNNNNSMVPISSSGNNSSNIERFHMSHRGVEFFSVSDREENRRMFEELNVRGMYASRLVGFTNLSSLVKEGTLIRRHVKLRVRVKKIKYLRIRLNCARCAIEWTQGMKACISCRSPETRVAYSFQVLVQDEAFLDEQAYLYISDENAIAFFAITEAERRILHKYLLENETFMQMYYSIRKNYPLEIIKFKDRIFTKDLTRSVVAIPFADLRNKVFSENQKQAQWEHQRALNEEFKSNIMGDSSTYGNKNGTNSNNDDFEAYIHKKTTQGQVFMNGTLVQLTTSQSANSKNLRPIPCLRVLHVFPVEKIITQTIRTLEEINKLKQQLQAINH